MTGADGVTQPADDLGEVREVWEFERDGEDRPRHRIVDPENPHAWIEAIGDDALEATDHAPDDGGGGGA